MRQVLSIAVLGFLAACGSDEPCCTLEITVTVPDDTDEVYVTGNMPQLGPWSPGEYLMQGEGKERTAVLDIPRGTGLEYKFTLGSWAREAVDDDRKPLANFRLVVDRSQAVHHDITGFKPDPMIFVEDWRGSGVKGTLVYWTDVSSEFLGPSRHVSVWLPPGYDGNREAPYPVLLASGDDVACPERVYSEKEIPRPPDASHTGGMVHNIHSSARSRCEVGVAHVALPAFSSEACQRRVATA